MADFFGIHDRIDFHMELVLFLLLLICSLTYSLSENLIRHFTSRLKFLKADHAKGSFVFLAVFFHSSLVFMSSLISSVMQQFGFPLSFIVFTGACLSRISLNNELKAYNLSSASSKASVIDHGACNISAQN